MTKLGKGASRLPGSSAGWWGGVVSGAQLDISCSDAYGQLLLISSALEASSGGFNPLLAAG